MSQERFTHFVCPNCGTNFSHGPEDRFGPSQFKCGKCGEVLRTNLTTWADLSLKDKIVCGILEVVDPFKSHNIITFLLFHSGLFLLITIPLGFIIAGSGSEPAGLSYEELKQWKEVTPFIVGGIVYLGLLIARMIYFVMQSQKYTRTGVPPTWG